MAHRSVLTRSAVLSALVITFILATSGTALADVMCWTRKASMPTPRWRAMSGVVAGQVIVLGGTTDPNYPPDGLTAAVQAYNPSLNTWRTMTPIQAGPRFAAGSASSGDYIYIAGGGTTSAPPEMSDQVIRYDGVSGANSVVGHLDTARFRDACVIVGNYLYVIGGNDFVTGALTSIEKYNLTTNQVDDVLNLPAARDNCAAVAVGTKIYIFGGWDMSGSPTRTVYELNTATGSIVQQGNMPVSRFGYKGALGFSNGMIRVQGALYNPASDTWSIEQFEPDMSWTSPVAEVVNDRVYRIGGNYSDYGGSVTGKNECSELAATLGEAIAAAPSSGGTTMLSVGSYTVSVGLPSGSYSGQMLGVSQLDSPPLPALAVPSVGKVFDISTTAAFSGHVTITLPYDPLAANPTIYHWNGSSWDALATTVNAQDHTVSAQSTSLSPFTVGDGSTGVAGQSASIYNVPASSDWSLALLVLAGAFVLVRSPRRRAL